MTYIGSMHTLGGPPVPGTLVLEPLIRVDAAVPHDHAVDWFLRTDDRVVTCIAWKVLHSLELVRAVQLLTRTYDPSQIAWRAIRIGHEVFAIVLLETTTATLPAVQAAFDDVMSTSWVTYQTAPAQAGRPIQGRKVQIAEWGQAQPIVIFLAGYIGEFFANERPKYGWLNKGADLGIRFRQQLERQSGRTVPYLTLPGRYVASFLDRYGVVAGTAAMTSGRVTPWRQSNTLVYPYRGKLVISHLHNQMWSDRNQVAVFDDRGNLLIHTHAWWEDVWFRSWGLGVSRAPKPFGTALHTVGSEVWQVKDPEHQATEFTRPFLLSALRRSPVAVGRTTPPMVIG